jgi:hypothetical protein
MITDDDRPSRSRRRRATNSSPFHTSAGDGSRDEGRSSCVRCSRTNRDGGTASLAGVDDAHADHLEEDNTASPQTCIEVGSSAVSRHSKEEGLPELVALTLGWTAMAGFATSGMFMSLLAAEGGGRPIPVLVALRLTWAGVERNAAVVFLAP